MARAATSAAARLRGQVTAGQRLREPGAGAAAEGVRAARLDGMVTNARATALPALLAVALLAAGCGDGDAGAAAARSSAEATASEASGATPSDTPATTGEDDDAGEGADGDTVGDTGGDGRTPTPFPADTEPDTAEPSSGSLVGVTDVRLGRHQGFDRVVFEVGGQGTPGWEVRYVDAPASQGSGADVAVEGEAVLQVTLSGTGYPGDTGVEEWAGPDPLRARETEVVTEVVWDGTFEGTSVAFVGTSARAPFRVYLLEEPTRVVLEVADPG